MLRRFLLPLVLVSCLVAACGGGDDTPEPTPGPTETPAAGAPGTPEAALGAYVQQTFQKEFVPDCATAVVATDAGKLCATAKGDRDNLKAYTIGNVASEGSQWVILQNNGGTWAVASTTTITPDNAAVPGVPWPLRIGVDVVVTGTGNGLNVRTGPGLQAAAVDRIDDGTVIKLSAGPAPADNLQWWQVEGRSGWVVGDYLRYPDAVTPKP
jgi:hypothetical protein